MVHLPCTVYITQNNKQNEVNKKRYKALELKEIIINAEGEGQSLLSCIKGDWKRFHWPTC